jgi:hypothetical protein
MPRVMPSSTKPESVIIAVIARSSQTRVFGSEGSRLNTGSAITRLRVRQWSADIRSRRLKATRESWRSRWLRAASGLVAARRSWRGTFFAVDSIRPTAGPAPRPAGRRRSMPGRERVAAAARKSRTEPSRRSP